MTTRYMTQAEFEALSDEALYVMKMSGDEVVLVEEGAAAPEPAAPSADAPNPETPNPETHVPDVSFSFMPTSGKQATPVSAAAEQPASPATQPAPDAAPASGDMQMALLQKMVTLQQQTLAEVAALRAELAQLAGRIGDAASAPAAEDDDAIAQLQQMMQALDAEIAKQTGGDS
ncbi:MAG: hypothetical protein AAF601_06955 [Pseudomonadota bacterium]